MTNIIIIIIIKTYVSLEGKRRAGTSEDEASANLLPKASSPVRVQPWLPHP